MKLALAHNREHILKLAWNSKERMEDSVVKRKKLLYWALNVGEKEYIEREDTGEPWPVSARSSCTISSIQSC